MKSSCPILLLLFLSIVSTASAQRSPLPADTASAVFVREWLLEGGITIPFDGPVAGQEYRRLDVPMQQLRLGHRITRELWFLAAYDHYSEVRESIGPCPENIFPCPDAFTDDFRFHAATINLRWTFARSTNTDVFVTLGFGGTDIRRSTAHLFKLIAPAEIGVKGWVQRGVQFQWGPVVAARTLFHLDGQQGIADGAKISDPILIGLSFGLFARW